MTSVVEHNDWRDEMNVFRMIAIASEVADKVRETKLSPGYGHPGTAKVATGHGPCRHCCDRSWWVRMCECSLPLIRLRVSRRYRSRGRCLYTKQSVSGMRRRRGIRRSCCRLELCWMVMMRSRWFDGVKLLRMDRRRRRFRR